MNEFNGYAEHYAVGRAMIVYGGSFMSNLGKALQHADGHNQEKIRNTWPKEWDQYRDMAVHLYKNEGTSY